MSRRARAIVDASIAVAITLIVMLTLTLFTSTLSTPPLVAGRAWWVAVWVVLVIGTAWMLADATTGRRHLYCVAVSAALIFAHLIAYWLGLVAADAPTPALILTDFVFLGTAIAALTLVNTRRRRGRSADRADRADRA